MRDEMMLNPLTDAQWQALLYARTTNTRHLIDRLAAYFNVLPDPGTYPTCGRDKPTPQEAA